MDGKQLKEMIEHDIKTKQGKYKARKYYYYKKKNNKESDDESVYINGVIHDVESDDNKTNLYTNYFKLIVNQKINYLLSQEPAIDVIDKYTSTTVTDMLEDVSLSASLDITAWLHLYVKGDMTLDWVLVHDSEIIPIYDKYKKDIEVVVRYYKANKDKDSKDYKVEIWSKDGVIVQIVNIENGKTMDKIKCSHYFEEKTYQGELEKSEGVNFPFIPFIPLYNNKERLSDLDGIQELIDMYNDINSGLIDNINKFQEAIIKLSGFTGNSEKLKEIRNNMQKYKIIGMPTGGNDKSDIDYMSIDIPIEARDLMIKLLKENIFKISQSIDPDKEDSHTNLTNVVIMAKYSALDMKALGFEKQLKLFYQTFISYINMYYSDKSKTDLTFNKSQIFNESEDIDNCLKNLGMTSLELILENHPQVKDPKAEMLRIEAEREKNEQRQQKNMENQLNMEKKLSTDDISN